jgi:polyisoprenoid-binding protein YceI
MKTTLIYLLMALSGLLLLNSTATAQQPVKLIENNSSVTITGTSSLHDWKEAVEKFNVDLTMDLNEKKEVTNISKVNFRCQSASITSENSLMTSKTHDALQADKYPEISFRLSSIEKITARQGNFSGILAGDMHLAGVTKRVSIAFTGNLAGDRLTVKGQKVINMTDYNIKPPTAMLGALKTGEDVTVSFSLQFEVDQEALASTK